MPGYGYLCMIVFLALLAAAGTAVGFRLLRAGKL